MNAHLSGVSANCIIQTMYSALASPFCIYKILSNKCIYKWHLKSLPKNEEPKESKENENGTEPPEVELLKMVEDVDTSTTLHCILAIASLKSSSFSTTLLNTPPLHIPRAYFIIYIFFVPFADCITVAQHVTSTSWEECEERGFPPIKTKPRHGITDIKLLTCDASTQSKPFLRTNHPTLILFTFSS